MANNTPTHKPASKKHLARHEKEQRQIKTAVITTVAVLAVVAILAGYVMINTFIVKPNRVVATVGEQKITDHQFRERVQYTRFTMINQIAQYLQMADRLSAFGDYASQYRNLAIETAGRMDDNATLGKDILNAMIEDVFIAQKAEELGITVSKEEINAQIEEMYSYYPLGTPTQANTPTTAATPTISIQQQLLINTPTLAPTQTAELEATPLEGTPAATGEPTLEPTLEPSPTVEPTLEATPTPNPDFTATPEPSATPIPTEYTHRMFQKNYNITLDMLKVYNISRSDLESIIHANLLRDKVKEALTKDLPAQEEQVWARHILVATEEEAKTVLDRLNKGESWWNLATELSIDTSNNTQGGDLGWFGKNAMVEEFEKAAFALQKTGDISEPVQSKFGWHIIQLVAKGENPASESGYNSLKRASFQEFLDTQRTENESRISIVDNLAAITPTTPVLPDNLRNQMLSQ